MAVADHGGTRTIADRYELREELGRGGMGIVWRARDTVLDREVAIKEILVPAVVAPDERETIHARVHREARAAARLSDEPGVVTVHDVFDAEGHPWVVMQLVRGHSLHQEIQRGGRLPHPTVLRVATALLETLDAAHAHGVVHRDIKPENVLVADDSRVLLADFGIATLKGEPTLTQTGVLIGSPAYMAPERLAEQVDEPPSDLWSLGATLYAATEGESPFHRDTTPSSIAAVLTAPIPEPKNAGPLAPLISALLARTPGDRPTARAALDLLNAASDEADTERLNSTDRGREHSQDRQAKTQQATKDLPPKQKKPTTGNAKTGWAVGAASFAIMLGLVFVAIETKGYSEIPFDCDDLAQEVLPPSWDPEETSALDDITTDDSGDRTSVNCGWAETPDIGGQEIDTSVSLHDWTLEAKHAYKNGWSSDESPEDLPGLGDEAITVYLDMNPGVLCISFFRDTNLTVNTTYTETPEPGEEETWSGPTPQECRDNAEEYARTVADLIGSP